MPAGFYSLYGLIFKSRWSFPLPKIGSNEEIIPDVELAEGSEAIFSQARGSEPNANEVRWYRDVFHPDGSIYLSWSGLFEFLVSPDGRRIYGLPKKQDAWESFKTYLRGQVLPARQ